MPSYDPDHYQMLASQTGLHYVTDAQPGMSRRKCGKGFAYYTSDDVHITCKKQLKRIKSLAIPPAYSQVWICEQDNGHLQATGRDNRQRKQYRYHPKWQTIRNETKFTYVKPFTKALPHLRTILASDLQQKTMSKERVIAGMITLMLTNYVRIGSLKYAKAHQTYGVTTLRKKHSHISDDSAELEFEGKNGTLWQINITNKTLVRLLKRCEEIPGYELFKYIDEAGDKHVVASQDVNTYLQEKTGHPFTAKDIRTWAACRELLYELSQQVKSCEMTDPQAMSSIYESSVKHVTKLLGHTRAVCKKSYIHPDIASHWENGSIHQWCKQHDASQKDVFFNDWWKHHIIY